MVQVCCNLQKQKVIQRVIKNIGITVAVLVVAFLAYLLLRVAGCLDIWFDKFEQFYVKGMMLFCFVLMMETYCYGAISVFKKAEEDYYVISPVLIVAIIWVVICSVITFGLFLEVCFFCAFPKAEIANSDFVSTMVCSFLGLISVVCFFMAAVKFGKIVAKADRWMLY